MSTRKKIEEPLSAGRSIDDGSACGASTSVKRMRTYDAQAI
ncbi:hypothetical protein VDGD_20690 [Verticillium dahliae]|nr:hypothetical protein VDGD_20690 [Verticillium dahliae]